MVSSGAIVRMAVGVLLIGVLVPIGITQIMSANTTGWDAAVTTVFTVVLPILCTLGLAMEYVPKGKK